MQLHPRRDAMVSWWRKHMSTNRSKSGTVRLNKQAYWGTLIRQMREARGWKRRELIARYQQRLEEQNPNYDLSEIPSETWLGRVENGKSATVTRQNIVLLCEALECSQQDQVNVLLAADRNIFASPEGEMSQMDEFFARTYKQIAHNPKALQTIAHKMQNYSNADELDSEEALKMLLTAVQQALDDLKKTPPEAQSRPPSDSRKLKKPAVALSGAD